MLKSSERVRKVSILFVEHLSEFLPRQFTRIKINYLEISKLIYLERRETAQNSWLRQFS